MIPELAELLSRRGTPNAQFEDASSSDDAAKRVQDMSSGLKAQAKAAEIDPVALEAELRNELHEALRHLDNCVDLLGTAALQQAYTFGRSRASIGDENVGNKFSPEICYKADSRSFSVYWRQATKVLRQHGKCITYTARMPIRKSAASDEIGYSMNAFRSVKSEELKEHIRTAEQRFRDLRKAMRSIVLARTKIGVADAAARSYFDSTVIGRTDERVLSAAPETWPFEEEPNRTRFIRFPGK